MANTLNRLSGDEAGNTRRILEGINPSLPMPAEIVRLIRAKIKASEDEELDDAKHLDAGAQMLAVNKREYATTVLASHKNLPEDVRNAVVRAADMAFVNQLYGVENDAHVEGQDRRTLLQSALASSRQELAGLRTKYAGEQQILLAVDDGDKQLDLFEKGLSSTAPGNPY